MPIFIGGMFKSGTSLTRKYFGNHPDIFTGLETNWFYLDSFYIDKDNNKLKNICRIWSEFYEINEDELINLLKPLSSSESALDNLMKLLINKKKLPDWCDKSPPNIAYSERIFKFWPNAKLIHIKRDPFDIYTSLKEAKKWNTPKEFMDRWSRIFKAQKLIKDNKNFIEFRYEHLILYPNETLRKMFKFCNLDWNNKYSIHNPNIEEFDLVKSATGKESTTLKRLALPVSTNRIGIYKNGLSKKEKDIIYDLVKKLDLEFEFNNALYRE